MRELLESQIKASIEVKQRLLEGDQLVQIEKAIKIMVKAFKSGKKLLVFGNGGSAADAQHFVAEFVNKFRKDREALPAIALTTDTSNLTAIGNDSGYDHVFERQVEALCDKGDVVVGITTSDVELQERGHSANIALGLQKAKEKGAITIGLVSLKSHKILELLDLAIVIPGKDTPRIQEAQLLVEHLICDLVEQAIFPE